MNRIESGSSDRLQYEEPPGCSGVGLVLCGLTGIVLVRAKYPDDILGTAIAIGLGSLWVLAGLRRVARRSGLEVVLQAFGSNSIAKPGASFGQSLPSWKSDPAGRYERLGGAAPRISISTGPGKTPNTCTSAASEIGPVRCGRTPT